MYEIPFTKVPNSIFDIQGLNVYEFRILMHIIRKTIGFNKEADGISISQFIKATGISKPTVVKTIKSLEKMKFIKVQNQTHIGGGKSFNKYLPLVKEIDYLVKEINKGSKGDLLGVVNEVNIQKENRTKENKQKKREGETPFSNIFFSLNKNESLRESEKYILYLIDQEEYVKSIPAFTRKIKKQLSKNDEHQLEDFEKWYIEKECEVLKEKYLDKYLDDDHISNIYSYFHTEGYDQSNKFIIWFNKDEKAFSFTECFDSKSQIEEFLKGAE